MSEPNVLRVEISGAQLALLQYYNEKYDREHSLSYTLEECLVAGMEAKKRSKEYSEATNNRKKFEKAIAMDPTIITRPSDMLALCKKFGIGASNANLEKQVLEAATAPAMETKVEEKAA